MQSVTAAGLFPHPPIMIPAIGGKELSKIKKTITAEKEAMRQMAEQHPETVIVMTPHNLCFAGGPAIFLASHLEGSMADFGHDEVRLAFDTDQELIQAIQKEAAPVMHLIAADDKLARQNGETLHLDWGAFTPLYYLKEAGFKGKIVLLSPSFSSWETNEVLGGAVWKAAARLGRRIAVIASGDLSHKLTPNSPNGYTPNGKIFDEKVMDALEHRNKAPLLSMSSAFIREIAMCGLPSVYFLFGILGKRKAELSVLSHEGPFGVGYGIAFYLVQKEEEKKSEDIRVKLARKSILHYLQDHTVMNAPNPLPEALSSQAGAFVSLHEFGALRGCIGTFRPLKKNLAEEIIENAKAAAFDDPRFPEITKEEAENLDISVDVLSEPEPVDSPKDLDPKKYGVIVQGYNGRLGLLLPDLEGVNTPEEQIAICRSKGGIGPHDPVRLYRFTVTRYF